MTKVSWKIHVFPRQRTSRENMTGGQEARERAEQELARVQAETPYYARLGSDLRSLRERNHFAENIRATLKGV